MASELTPPEASKMPADNDDCSPDDIALKSLFLGPQSENADWFDEVFRGVLTAYFSWRRRMYSRDGEAISEADRQTPQFRQRRREIVRQMQTLMERFEAEVPTFSPRYIGHMFSETSMPAMIGHVITLLHNPNNIGGESSRVGIEIEAEAIESLAAMLGFDGDVHGHFTSGGTVANFEGMVRARRRLQRFLAVGAAARATGDFDGSLVEAAHLGWDSFDRLRDRLGDDGDPRRFDPAKTNPFAVAQRLRTTFETTYLGPVILVPAHKHYSWTKGVELMGLGEESFWPVEVDDRGRMSLSALESRIDEAHRSDRPIMMVVSVAGTTELGTFDPVDRIQDLLDDYRDDRGLDIYHHVDAAYGGFFAAGVGDGASGCGLDDQPCRALAAISRANSATLDPHKLGYVPYASGTFVCADGREYVAHDIDAPYVDFDDGRDPGLQTIEGSRSAAGAVATWLTARTVGLDDDGYGRILGRTVSARHRLREALAETDLPVRFAPGDSNILTFCIAPDGQALSETNATSRALYEAFSPDKNGEFFVSKTALRFSDYDRLLESFVDGWNADVDDDELVLVRLCVMNPFLDSRETDTDFPQAFARAVQRQLN